METGLISPAYVLVVGRIDLHGNFLAKALEGNFVRTTMDWPSV